MGVIESDGAGVDARWIIEMAHEPIDSKGLEAFVRAMQQTMLPVVTAFDQFAAAMAQQAFSLNDLLKEALERVRVAEEERQRRAMMARITQRVWQATSGLIVCAWLLSWWLW